PLPTVRTKCSTAGSSEHKIQIPAKTAKRSRSSPNIPSLVKPPATIPAKTAMSYACSSSLALQQPQRNLQENSALPQVRPAQQHLRQRFRQKIGNDSGNIFGHISCRPPTIHPVGGTIRADRQQFRQYLRQHRQARHEVSN